MDRKSIIILVICGILLIAWPKLVSHYYPTAAVPESTNQVYSSSTDTSTGTNSAAPGHANPEAYQPPALTGSNAPAPFMVDDAIPEELLTVTNGDAIYTFTSRGGGLQRVVLTRYPESVSRIRVKLTQTNAFATLNTPVAPPVLAILGVGTNSLQGDGVFKLTQSNNVVWAEKKLADGLTVRKEFRVGSDYLVAASVQLVNNSRQPLALPPQQWVAGVATPMNPQDIGQRVGIMWYDGNKALSPVTVGSFKTNTTILGLFRRTPMAEYHAGDSNVVWLSAQNQFFSLAAMPMVPAPGFSVWTVHLPPPSEEEIESVAQTVVAPNGLLAALDYPAVTLAPGHAVTQNINFFTGPKEYHTLARLGDELKNHIDLIMGFSGFFGMFAKGLLWAMNLLHNSLRVPYGLAIVVITVVIKMIFWPLTKYSTQSMKRMQALQPQMKALQAKYKDDPAKLSQKQMEFWKKNKVNPMSGCLPMMLQLPVLWGWYRMLQSAIELRGAHFLWIGDLSKPDTLFTVPLPLAALGFHNHIFPFNPLPIIMGATMLWQTSLTPPAPGMDPGQQKMMRLMPLMMPILFYNFSSGLALYWTVQNLLTVYQTKTTQSRQPPGPTPPATTTAAAPMKKKK